MKKLALSLAAIASVAAAAPSIANAQLKFPWGYNNNGYAHSSINQREQRIEWQIRQGQRNGEITFGEARSLRVQLASIERLERMYARGGLNRAEFIDLNSRLNRLEGQVSVAMNDFDRGREYGSGYGYGWR